MASFLHASLGLALPLWLAGAPPATPTSLVLVGDQLLLGTERGLYRNAPEGWSLVLTRGGVRDLAVTSEVVWIATGAGLYAWSPAGAPPLRIVLAGGELNAVDADAEATVWVAGRGGLFRRRADDGDFARELSLPGGEVAAVRCAGREVWVATRATLWVRSGAAGFARVLHGLEDGWWELRAAAVAGDETLLAVPSGLWRIGPHGAQRLELGIGEVHALRVSGDTVHVASERGVYPYPVGRLDSAVAAAALVARAVALARRGSELLVATPRGVAALPLGAPSQALLGLRGTRGTQSEIGDLQRTVLAYLELSPRRLSRIEARARRSPWLPQVRASLGVDRDRSRDRDYDEVLSSGAVRGLVDVTREHERNLDFDLQLVWDLARAAEPDQALAISRERRQLVELRDSVLERVNRLYFERERVLGRLAGLAEGAATGERVELELRERELAARLDGWTGGLFTRRQIDSPRRRRP